MQGQLQRPGATAAGFLSEMLVRWSSPCTKEMLVLSLGGFVACLNDLLCASFGWLQTRYLSTPLVYIWCPEAGTNSRML
jgi:hypothetical protein